MPAFMHNSKAPDSVHRYNRSRVQQLRKSLDLRWDGRR
jgi:hypothetical protein